jgi:hypothetical protein
MRKILLTLIPILILWALDVGTTGAAIRVYGLEIERNILPVLLIPAVGIVGYTTFYLGILCLFFFGMLKLSNILQLKNYGFLVFNYIPIIFFMTLTVSNNFVFLLSIK